jgi:hypothetical protein
VVSIDREGNDDHPTWDASAMASCGLRRYWRWKSWNLGGRPPIDAGLRALIRRMSIENMLWGAPRIHGELLKLGFKVAESTVSKYMMRHRGPPSQTWRTFLRNHAEAIMSKNQEPLLSRQFCSDCIIDGYDFREGQRRRRLDS